MMLLLILGEQEQNKQKSLQDIVIVILVKQDSWLTLHAFGYFCWFARGENLDLFPWMKNKQLIGR